MATLTIQQVNQIPAEPQYVPTIVAENIEYDAQKTNVNFLNYYSTQNYSHFIDTNIPVTTTAETINTGSVILQYKRSIGVSTIGINIVPHYLNQVESFYVKLILPPSCSLIYSTPTPFITSSSQLNSSSIIFQAPTGSREQPIYSGFVNVHSANTSSILAITASFFVLSRSATGGSSRQTGIKHISAFEIPRKTIDFGGVSSAPVNTVGINFQYFTPVSSAFNGNPYSAGKPFNKSYTEAIVDLKNKIRNQLNLSFLSTSSDSHVATRQYSDGIGIGDFTWGNNIPNLSALQKKFFIKTNKTYGNNTSTAPFSISVAYKTAEIGSHDIILNYRASGSVGSYSTKTITLPIRTNIGYFTDTVLLPTTGSSGVVECYLQAQTYDETDAKLWIYNFFMCEALT